ncbi:MAG: DUF2812 domain-containing protein [Ruminiclostridium sp.]
MAKKGYILEKYRFLGVYTFIKAEPKDLHYKIDYRTFKKNEFEEYKALFEDTGWVHICGTKYTGAQYFLPSSNNVDSPDIFSDAASKAARYKRIKNQYIVLLIVWLIYFFALFSSSGFKFKGYLTPGLWERTGISFWFGLLFETPFVVLISSPYIIFLLFTILYGYLSYKAHQLYKKNLKDNGNSCL